MNHRENSGKCKIVISLQPYSRFKLKHRQVSVGLRRSFEKNVLFFFFFLIEDVVSIFSSGRFLPPGCVSSFKVLL